MSDVVVNRLCLHSESCSGLISAHAPTVANPIHMGVHMLPDESAGSWLNSAPVSRRRLLRGAAAVAAGAAGAAGAGTPGLASRATGVIKGPPVDPYAEAYRLKFETILRLDRQVKIYDETSCDGSRNRGFLCRPNQLIVHTDDLARVLAKLRTMGYSPDTRTTVHVLALVDVGAAPPLIVDIKQIVEALREPTQWWPDLPPRVQPNHITFGQGKIMGNPDGAPLDATGMSIPTYTGQGRPTGEGGTIKVGIFDTGIAADAATTHRDWLGTGYNPTIARNTGNEDPLNEKGKATLGAAGGHGTFVAGVLRQAATDVQFVPKAVLNPDGYGDEFSIALALKPFLSPGNGVPPAEEKLDIINLSLGYTSQGDVKPLLELVFPPDTLVVASAGNSGGPGLVWPASYSDVISVAAVTDHERQLVRTQYSSFGETVNACAYGERVSTYVRGSMQFPPLPDGTIVNPRNFSTGWAKWQGTSFAAPHVAGRLARVMSATGWSAREAWTFLTTAQPNQPVPYRVPGCGVFIA